MAKNKLEQDYMRYPKASDMPAFQKYFRKVQSTRFFPLQFLYKVIFRLLKEIRHIEISRTTQIGEGLYIGHAYNITINPKAILGKNINIHRGVLIGQTNRGGRQGTPVIGNEVWIGINVYITIKLPHLHGKTATVQRQNCHTKNGTATISNFCI